MTLTVAIVGRPNVGKSTLFNRLAAGRSQLSTTSPALRAIARKPWDGWETSTSS